MKSLSIEQKRADIYRLLAACYYQPSIKLFSEENVFGNLKAALKGICPEAAHHACRMKKALEKTSEEELLTEHARLFVGPYQLAAPPYGSIYLENQRRVMGQTTLETKKLYEEAGVSIHDEMKEPPDHIAFELEFLSYLSTRLIQNLLLKNRDEEYRFRKLRQNFRNNYLGKWIIPFTDTLGKNTENPIYNSLAHCTSSFFQEDTCT